MRKMSIETTEKDKTRIFKRRIGQTTYHVGIHFNKASNETMDDKIIRLVRNDVTCKKVGINQ